MSTIGGIPVYVTCIFSLNFLETSIIQEEANQFIKTSIITSIRKGKGEKYEES